MQSSIMSRIFPPSGPVLPQHERQSLGLTREQPHHISSRTSESSVPSQHLSHSTRNTLQPAPLSASIVHYTDPFLPIDRATKALERNIQSFLDAQSEGLLAGLGAAPQDDISSNGSLTPTPSISTPTSTSRPKTIPIRQPKKNTVSLKGARKGLARSMRDFVVLKEEEIKVLNEQERMRRKAIESIEVFEDKRHGLSSQITSIQNESDTQHASGLKAEARQLESDITRLENELAEKKARHRHLIDQVQQTENSIQSKLSSFQTSIKMLDSDIKAFLKRPPITQSLQIAKNNNHDTASSTSGNLDFYSLHPQRRTLDMAKEHWQEEDAILRDRKKDVETEMTALKTGSAVWRDVVAEINAFEKWLQNQTSHAVSLGDTNNIQQQNGENNMSMVLKRMDTMIGLLSQRFQLAEDNSWNLLVCCIGAELEAYREGKALLARTLGLVEQEDEEGGRPTDEAELIAYGEATNTNTNINGSLMHGSNESLKATLLAMNEATASEQASAPAVPEMAVQRPDMYPHSESEDEGPGPDFLISHDE